MPEGLIETAAQGNAPTPRRLSGVVEARVLENVDPTGQARVRIELTRPPGYELWARVAVPLAGPDRGTFFIPQPDDEVLVAFYQGDVRQPYVIGSLWNGKDRPPAAAPGDAVSKRIVRTPRGLEIELDDEAESIRLSSPSGQSVTLDGSKVELTAGDGEATVTLEASGKVTLKAAARVELSAPEIALDGSRILLTSDGSIDLKAAGLCRVEGSLVKIN